MVFPKDIGRVIGYVLIVDMYSIKISTAEGNTLRTKRRDLFVLSAGAKKNPDLCVLLFDIVFPQGFLLYLSFIHTKLTLANNLLSPYNTFVLSY